MTLREAADRTSRSITTLRRYIRSGRLRAEKRNGRYGPEYFVSETDLHTAGLETDSTPIPQSPGNTLPIPAGSAIGQALDLALRESVPLAIYQELQMKHEQLLVQYGMVRAAGMKVMDLQAELESRDRKQTEDERSMTRLREQLARETALLSKRLRQAELELESKRIEIATLKEKSRELELMARNAATTASVERQFSDVQDQVHRVHRLDRERTPSEPSGFPFLPGHRKPTDPGPDH
jgi:hypothetical protein